MRSACRAWLASPDTIRPAASSRGMWFGPTKSGSVERPVGRRVVLRLVSAVKMVSTSVVGPHTLPPSPVPGCLLHVEGGDPSRPLHELALRVRQIEPEEGAVAEPPGAPRRRGRARGGRSRGRARCRPRPAPGSGSPRSTGRSRASPGRPGRRGRLRRSRRCHRCTGSRDGRRRRTGGREAAPAPVRCRCGGATRGAGPGRNPGRRRARSRRGRSRTPGRGA